VAISQLLGAQLALLLAGGQVESVEPEAEPPQVDGGLLDAVPHEADSPQVGDAGQPRPDLTEMDIEQLMSLEVQTVVSASRYEQKETRAPASVVVVTADDIRTYGYRTLADALNGVRGLYTTTDRAYTFLGFRGFNRPGDYNSRVLLLVDGHQINENVYDGALVGEFVLDLDLVDRIEVVFGPSSSLYGGNALFGVVNVITRRLPPGLEVALDGASSGALGGRASCSWGNAKGQGPQVTLSVNAVQDPGESFALTLPDGSEVLSHQANGERRLGLFARAEWKDWSLLALYSSRSRNDPTGDYGTLINDARNLDVDTRAFVELRFQHAFASATVLAVRGSYDYYGFDADYAYATSSGGSYLNHDKTRGQWLEAEVRGEQTILGKHRLIAGFELRVHLQQDQQNWDDGGPLLLDDHRHSAIFGGYLQGEANPWHFLQLTAGVRYDHYSTFGDTLNPRAALILGPFWSTSLKLIYGRAFRPPNVEELYYGDGGLTSKPPLPGALKPETIDTVELVLEHTVQRWVQLTLLGYRYQMHDLIELTRDPVDGLLVYDNIGSVVSLGLEAQVDFRTPWGISGGASYALQRAVDAQTGERLTNSPTHLAKLHLSVPLYWRWLRLGAEVLLMDRRLTLSQQWTSFSVIPNLTLTAEHLGGVLDVSASLYNLFDDRAGDPASQDHSQDVLPREGRVLRIKLVLHF
jgi:iron complex outermembrane receptor protein